MRIASLFDDPSVKTIVSSAEADAKERLGSLTNAQRQVLAMIIDGNLNKQTASLLGISQRTVENHRMEIMRRVSVRTVPQLVRLCILAGV